MANVFTRHKTTTIVIATLVVIFLLLFFLARFVYVTGLWADSWLNLQVKVYEWVNPPGNAESKIYVSNVLIFSDMESTMRLLIADIPTDIDKSMLGDATIKISRQAFWPSFFNISGHNYILYEETTNESGEYRNRNLSVGGGHSYYEFEISKPGYKSVMVRNEPSGDIHYNIIAILVKNNK